MRREKGSSLIEFRFLILVAVMAIVAAIAIASYMDHVESKRIKAEKQALVFNLEQEGSVEVMDIEFAGEYIGDDVNGKAYYNLLISEKLTRLLIHDFGVSETAETSSLEMIKQEQGEPRFKLTFSSADLRKAAISQLKIAGMDELAAEKFFQELKE